mgnify:CR=1 FL=1
MIVIEKDSLPGDAVEGRGLDDIIDSARSRFAIDRSIPSPVIGKKKQNIGTILAEGHSEEAASEDDRGKE